MFQNNRVSIGKIIGEMEFQKVFFGTMPPRWHFRRRLFGRDFCFELNGKMNPHVLIVGESGSGKSNLCKLITKELACSKICFALLDPHNEYVESARSFNATPYNAAYNGINVFDLDKMDSREKTEELVGIFSKTFRLGQVQSNLLYKCIEYMYRVSAAQQINPNIHTLLYTVKVFKRHAGKVEANVLDSLEKRMVLLNSGAFTQSVNINKIMSSNSIFALSSLHTNEAQHIYIEGLLRKIYSNMLGMEKSSGTRFYIIIDEAEKLDDESIISRLVAEGRKYGIGVICIAQRAKAINKEVRGNSSLFVAFSQREPEELNYIANFISGGNEGSRFIEVKKALRNLGRGGALVLDFRGHEPKLVRFELFKEEARDPSYYIDEMARNAVSESEMLEKLNGMGFDMSTVDWSVIKLAGDNKLSEYVLKESQYRGKWYISGARNSAEHDIMVNIISKHLKSIGISNFIYNNSYGPDLVAFSEGKRIAIEYETGSSRLDRAVRMLEQRAQKYNEVVVVTNMQSYSRYQGIRNIRLLNYKEFFNLSGPSALMQ